MLFNNQRDFYKDKVVLITGASMGIGKELASQVLSQGGKVVITARRMDGLEKAKEELSVWKENILCHQGDAADHQNNVELVKKTVARFGKLDILINNAGLSSYGEVEQTDASVARQIIDTNIYGSLFPVIAAIPELRKSQGIILFVSSVAAFYGLPGFAVYSMSKMSLRSLAQSLTVELSASGVSVCIAFLGVTENERGKRTLSPHGEKVIIPQSPKYLTTTRKATANKILKQIRNRKSSNTYSLVGNITAAMSRNFPSLTGIILKYNYRNGKLGYRLK